MANENTRPKVRSLDGLRGMAALVVMLTHYKLMLYPRYADLRYPYQNGLAHLPFEWVIEKLPFMAFFSGGTVAVFVFFVLSGFSLSYQYMRAGDWRILASMALRRGFRLGIPIAAAVLLAFILMRLGLMATSAAAPLTGSQWWLGGLYQEPATLRSAILDAFGGILFQYRQRYSTAFWSMPVEMLCSYVVFAVLPLARLLRLRYQAVILVVLFATTPFLPPLPTAVPQIGVYLIYFATGILLCAVHVRANYLLTLVARWLDRARVARLVLLLVAITPILYPAIIRDIAVYLPAPLSVGLGIGPAGQSGWAEIGAGILFVMLILTSPRAQRLLERPFPQWLGRLSFAAYLIHIPILGSVACLVFLKLYGFGLPYNLVALLTCAISFPVTYGVSHVFARYIDRFAIGFGRKTVDAALRRVVFPRGVARYGQVAYVDRTPPPGS